MKWIELELEHRYKTRLVGRHFLKPSQGRTFVGCAKNAHIRLLGESVAGVHAAFEFENGVWTIADLGSEQGTWVDKNPIIEHTLSKATEVHIGGHSIRVFPREVKFSVMDSLDKEVKLDPNKEIFHQVIVRRHGLVVTSLVAPQGEPLKIEGLGAYNSPKSGAWVKTQVGPHEILQRLVNSEIVKESAQERLARHWDPSLKIPTMLALLFFFLLSSVLIFMPKSPTEDLVEIKPDSQLYTKLIYDAKTIAKARKEAMKTRNIVGHSKAAPNMAATGNSEMTKINTNKNSSGSATKVVSQLKSQQLNSLIGKIAKRSAATGVFVTAQGRNPDDINSGHSLAQGTLTKGSTLEGKGNVGVSGAESGQKIAGVGTSGKGGGSSQYKGVGGLSLGNVGNASVGVLEEETEVEGGLDRDVIARVIQSQLGQIRYCYERQLSASPDLYGKVQVKFTIGSEGSVQTQAIGNSSLSNAMVEGCILRRIAGWQFPKPKGGTQVIVTYPFLFKSTR